MAIMGMTYHLPCMLSQCPLNALNALYHRHLTKPPYATTRKLENFFLTRLFPRLQFHYQQHYQEEMQDEWFVGKGTAKVRAILDSKKFDKLEYNCCKSFIKLEVVVKVPTKARLIQGHMNEATAYHYPTEYSAISKALQDLSKEDFYVDGIRFRFIYAGGMNHDELSDAFTAAVEVGVIFDERDGKNWDATMNEILLSMEADIYDRLNMLAAKFHRLRSSGCIGLITFRNGLRFVAAIRYFIAWKRLSGDWNTSVGNSIISMLIAFNNILDLPKELRPQSVVAFFMGDDYLGLYKYNEVPCLKRLLAALNDLDRSAGITPERGLFTEPTAVTFISLMVWPRRNGGFQFVPKPAKQLSKAFCTHRQIPAKLRQPYRNVVALGLLPSYLGFRFMVDFLRNHYSPLVSEYDYSQAMEFKDYRLKLMTTKYRNVDWVRGFWLHYNLPIEALPVTGPSATGVYYHPIVQHMLSVELADPMDRPSCMRSFESI